MTKPVIAEELPWLDGARARLQSAWLQQRMPHALLIYGIAGVGKHVLADWIARAVLCDRNAETLAACGECTSCRLYQSSTHPDLRWLMPEEDKQQISVDQIREMCASLAMTSFRQGYKVAVVEPAQMMTTAAANSLLKTLEEPSPRTVLILIATRLNGLLPTIRSRCQQIAVPVPSQRVAQSWLERSGLAQSTLVSTDVFELARGAPLKALEYAKSDAGSDLQDVADGLAAYLAGRVDVTQVAKRWANEGLPQRLMCLEYCLERLVRSTLLGIDDRFTRDILPSGTGQLNIKRIFECIDTLRELRARLDRVALQRELALESLLITLSNVLRLQAA
jgi:DNA polymerase III subunit delta'